MPGYEQQQLYSIVKTMVTANYVSPKTVLSDNEPVNLCITGTEDIMFSIVTNTLSYNIVIQFKDGKIKFQPNFISLTTQGLEAVQFNHGKPRPVMKKVIAQCEAVINDIYSRTVSADKLNDDDNW